MKLARDEFQRQHEGRNLQQHRLRGTYVSANIAALWNQHVRSILWVASLTPDEIGEVVEQINKVRDK